ncbi:MAG TPA: Crp/Fnr family transcriptional regulator [Acetobacteraceae bacterium]|nr:Crp/Fnr family transcriptional regulator [Acetobacteraceae bacterium]
MDLLPPPERDRLWPFTAPIEFREGHVIQCLGDDAEHVYFLQEGALAYIVECCGHSVQVGTVGRNNLLNGLALFVPGAKACCRSVALVPARARRAVALLLRQNEHAWPSLFHLAWQDIEAQYLELAQTAGCNAAHSVVQRMARRLLSVHELVRSEALSLPATYVSEMVGATAEDVRCVAASLAKAGAVRTDSDRVTIVDRTVLERLACSCGALSVVNRRSDRTCSGPA